MTAMDEDFNAGSDFERIDTDGDAVADLKVPKPVGEQASQK
jgi:hypothetical protein